MTSTSADTYYARPVYLPMDKGRIKKATSTDILVPKNGLKNANKRIRFADCKNVEALKFSNIENSSPPLRPPPPRPTCVKTYSEYAVPHRDKPKAVLTFVKSDPQTSEQKPLILSNDGNHDVFWRRDDSNISIGTGAKLRGGLPLMTNQTLAETLHNYDTADINDCISDHSDSSVDTIIMMTTDEERKNQEKINRGQYKYTSVKTKSDRNYTNKSKATIQNEANSYAHISDSNSLNTSWVQVPNGTTEEPLYSKVVPLHIRTENKTTGHSLSSSENTTIKTNNNQGSPNDSPDDGYGTNSSTGTASSPFSSSFVSSDLEHSCNGHSKRIILRNGAIKPTSVRESWAVKRKQRMTEAQDNTVQEQLRELTIIEEEGNVNRINSHDINVHSAGIADRGNASKLGIKMADRSRSCRTVDDIVLSNVDLSTANSGSRGNLNYQVPFINVSSNDLQRIDTHLYVMESARKTNIVNQNVNDRMPQASQRVDCSGVVQSSVTNEINGIQQLPHQNTYNGFVHSLQQTGKRIERNTRTGGSLRSERSLRVATNLRPEGTEIASSGNINEISVQNNASCGRFLPQSGNELLRTSNGSGKIYISPSGDEGLYSLNQSSRRTSISSFQPISELTENRRSVLGTHKAPAAPLETLSGDMLKKWCDMDINYRNYYGFDEQGEKYSRTNSKVNYFQEKNINNAYGHDNYYRPQTYAVDTQTGRQTPIQGITSDSTDMHIPNHEKTLSNHDNSIRPKNHEKVSGAKNRLFKILPSMFKSSNKNQNPDTKDKKEITSIKKAAPVTIEVPQEVKCDLEPEAEYVNLGDLPQYSLANIEYEEKLKKGQFVSLEHLPGRPVFASSRDIKELFSNHDKSFDSLNNLGGQRHSFHAMPLSYRHNVSTSSVSSKMRPRAGSTSASGMRGPEYRNSVDNRMAMISCKNASVMNQSREDLAGSTPSGTMVQATFRMRLDSDSSCGDSKLSTLV